MSERRVARRYEVAVPVFVGQNGIAPLTRPRGLTRDISTSGLYFTIEQPPTPGSRLELRLTLPASLTGSGDVHVKVVGRVVRVDQLKGARSTAHGGTEVASGYQLGVAAHIEKYDIISTDASHSGRTFAF